MQMDVRDMSFFPDESFDSIIDKGRDLSFHYKLYQYLRYVKLNFFVCLLMIFVFAMPYALCWSLNQELLILWWYDGYWNVLIIPDVHCLACSNPFICGCEFQCGTDAPISATQMLGEVSRL